jgi:hypothetical protein
VTDVLPAVVLVSATPSQGTCSGTTTITCNLGPVGGRRRRRELREVDEDIAAGVQLGFCTGWDDAGRVVLLDDERA